MNSVISKSFRCEPCENFPNVSSNERATARMREITLTQCELFVLFSLLVVIGKNSLLINTGKYLLIGKNSLLLYLLKLFLWRDTEQLTFLWCVCVFRALSFLLLENLLYIKSSTPLMWDVTIFGAQAYMFRNIFSRVLINLCFIAMTTSMLCCRVLINVMLCNRMN